MSEAPVRPRTRHRERYWQEHDKESYTCPDCGRGLPDVEGFEVHHIDGDYRNGDPDNLVGLCHSCHASRHRREEVDGRLIEMVREIEAMGGGCGGG